MPSNATFSLRTLREAVVRRVEETSIRAVAEEIGMSRSGLHVLLRGSTPQPATRAKLVRWYVEQRGTPPTQPDAVTAADVDAALRLLMIYVAQDGRESVQERRVREIVRRFETSVTPTAGKSRRKE
jgi:hypothetical protein